MMLCLNFLSPLNIRNIYYLGKRFKVARSVSCYTIIIIIITMYGETNLTHDIWVHVSVVLLRP